MPDGTQILVRTNAPPLGLFRAMRSLIAEVDSEQQIDGEIEELSSWISNGPEWQQERVALRHE